MYKLNVLEHIAVVESHYLITALYTRTCKANSEIFLLRQGFRKLPYKVHCNFSLLDHYTL